MGSKRRSLNKFWRNLTKQLETRIVLEVLNMISKLFYLYLQFLGRSFHGSGSVFSGFGFFPDPDPDSGKKVRSVKKDPDPKH